MDQKLIQERTGHILIVLLHINFTTRIILVINFQLILN